MNCEKCQTILPDEAIACWKCGTPVAETVQAPPQKDESDLLLAILTFVLSVAFFVCAGWSIPFTLWGLISTSVNGSSLLASLSSILSGLAFVASTIAVFGGCWWGCYWLLKRISRPA